MIRALLCWLGRHEWTDWVYVQGETDAMWDYDEMKLCLFCPAQQWRAAP